MEGEAQTDFVYCAGAATELLRCGTCVSERAPLVLVIPGNPGMVGFYRTFVQTLYRQCERRHPVWAVGHAGHCAPPDSMDMVEDVASVTRGDVFGLNGQIEHKLDFLKRHVPEDMPLVLVGHSIGCYIILEMMKRRPQLKVLKAIMLFPTIERMAMTSQGKVMTPVLCHLRYLCYLPVFLLSLLPATLQRSLVQLLLAGVHRLDQTVLQTTVGLLSGDCAANAMYMGGQEMMVVLERDNVTIKTNLDKLIFYYGADDPWCPVSYHKQIKHEFPDGDFRLCEKGFRHAFVLDAGTQMAELVSEWIRAVSRT